MKKITLLSISLLLLFTSCKDKTQNPEENTLSCVEYWAQIPFSDFCGLLESNFDFNTIPNDICNADQNSSYPYEDRVSIRVFNHFSESKAMEEYNSEKAYASSLPGYSVENNLGDGAFFIITTQFNELDFATVQMVKGTFTVYLEINGNASNGANNCFDENSVIDFAKALVDPL